MGILDFWHATSYLGSISAAMDKNNPKQWLEDAYFRDNPPPQLGDGYPVNTADGFGAYVTSCYTPSCTPPTVNDVAVTQPTGTTPTGTISVGASGSGTLEYSADNGSTWQSSNTFSGLANLSNLQEVTGTFIIKWTNLADLEGLKNLSEVGENQKYGRLQQRRAGAVLLRAAKQHRGDFGRTG